MAIIVDTPRGVPGAGAIVAPDGPTLPDFLDVFKEPRRILLIGLTGTGKTTQIGVFAEHLFLHRKQSTILYVNDYGSLDTINPYISVTRGGLLDALTDVIIPIRAYGIDPFIFADHAARGLVPTAAGWKPAKDLYPNVGCFAFDSATRTGEEQIKAMRDSQATNTPIGPKAYTVTIRGGGESLVFGTSDKSHYGITQGRIVDAMWESERLSCQQGAHVIWTAALRRVDQDEETKQALLGPDLAGRALTGVAPRWFTHTFPLTKVSSLLGPNRYILHLDAYQDAQMSGTQVVGNARVPLRGETFPVPNQIEPASLVTALNYLAGRGIAAISDVKQRLGL